MGMMHDGSVGAIYTHNNNKSPLARRRHCMQGHLTTSNISSIMVSWGSESVLVQALAQGRQISYEYVKPPLIMSDRTPTVCYLHLRRDLIRRHTPGAAVACGRAWGGRAVLEATPAMDGTADILSWVALPLHWEALGGVGVAHLLVPSYQLRNLLRLRLRRVLLPTRPCAPSIRSGTD